MPETNPHCWCRRFQIDVAPRHVTTGGIASWCAETNAEYVVILAADRFARAEAGDEIFIHLVAQIYAG